MRKLIFPIFLILISLSFFWQFFFKGFLPIPADTIVGMYYPWRDFYAKDYTRGVPFKNFLITDPVRQQYVWRKLAVEQIKNWQLPRWNPYNFSGTPLLANFQSAVFYPLNIIFFILPFNFGWTILIILQPLLAGLFLYIYLRNFKISQWGGLIGALSWSFSGFSIAWLEWNTIGHVVLWLPLILLSIDKMIFQNDMKWSLIFIFSLVSSFLAGHLQMFAYTVGLSFLYLFYRMIQVNLMNRIIRVKLIIFLTLLIGLTIFLTAIQWWPTMQFIFLSARSFDLPDWQSSSWFLPWQHLIQFVAPDFFGNPATLNYWGEWNYGEFIGYIGIFPLLMALMAIFWRRDRKTWLAIVTVLISLAFILPTPLAKLPYQLSIPFLSTVQPTRLMVIVDFCLAVLAALGFDWFIKCLHDSNHVSRLLKSFAAPGMIFLGMWIFVLSGDHVLSIESLAIVKRNLILPTGLFLISSVLLISLVKTRKKFLISLMIYIILLDMVFDLFRFGWKFTPFNKEEWVFPKTETIKFLQQQERPFRIMATDKRILPPNFSAFYKIEDVSGYDPLYLKSYGELVAAWYRNKPDISPFSFNRILTPQDYSSQIADLLNIKYVISLKNEVSRKLTLVSQEGQTHVYENKNVLPRAFFVDEIKGIKNKQEAIEAMFAQNFNPQKTAIVENTKGVLSTTPLRCEDCKAKILDYSENRIKIKTENQSAGFLVLSNIYYPGWQAKIDGSPIKIYLTNYSLMGILIPRGKHQIIFSVDKINL